jgi:hypothetical protein
MDFQAVAVVVAVKAAPQLVELEQQDKDIQAADSAMLWQHMVAPAEAAALAVLVQMVEFGQLTE